MFASRLTTGPRRNPMHRSDSFRMRCTTAKPTARVLLWAIFLPENLAWQAKTTLKPCRSTLSVDFINTIYKARFEEDQTKKEELYKNLFESDAPRFLGYFQRLLKENGDTGYLVGDSITQADLFLYNVIDAFIFEKADAASSFAPELKKLREQVESYPNLKGYFASRPKVEL